MSFPEEQAFCVALSELLDVNRGCHRCFAKFLRVFGGSFLIGTPEMSKDCRDV